MRGMATAIRVAAAGDIHCSDANRDELEHAFRTVDEEVDLVLLAGDLTTYGELDQAELLADICRPLRVPDRAAPLLADDDDPRGRAPRDLALPRYRPARAADRRVPPGRRPTRPHPRRHLRRLRWRRPRA